MAVASTLGVAVEVEEHVKVADDAGGGFAAAAVVVAVGAVASATVWYIQN
jgi:hypothetical protein